ncbi:MAG: hypothetical protein QM758_19400 [Armatimonas sp.]
MTLLPLLAATLLLSPQNRAQQQRLIPPPGIAIEANEKTDWEAGLTELAAALKKVERDPLYPDAAIFYKAVQWSLNDNTVYSPREKEAAKKLLAEGLSRAKALAAGQAPWTKQTGLVVRAYRSKLDGSLQPYGLVVPDNAFDGGKKRLDVWFHGRGETLTELAFCEQRMRSVGDFAPPARLCCTPTGASAMPIDWAVRSMCSRAWPM